MTALEEQDEVLARMSRGQSDATIARALELSERSVRRRLARGMTRLGARTRFQAGFLFAHETAPVQDTSTRQEHRAVSANSLTTASGVHE